ncbi:MAG: hypothetical protein K2M42_05090 [Oscillospiraceae bacterium]|nr:hypothetical protein [Oscillospiraceae bacterium]
MDICFEGVGQVAATFQVAGENVQPGMAVTLTGSGTVGLGADGGLPCGVVLGGVRGGAAAVQIGGAVKAAYTGTAPAVGWQELALDGEGNVKVVSSGEGSAKTAASGLKCLVLAVDEDEKSVVIKL